MRKLIVIISISALLLLNSVVLLKAFDERLCACCCWGFPGKGGSTFFQQILGRVECDEDYDCSKNGRICTGYGACKYLICAPEAIDVFHGLCDSEPPDIAACKYPFPPYWGVIECEVEK